MQVRRAVVFVDATAPHVWATVRACAAASFAHVDLVACSGRRDNNSHDSASDAAAASMSYASFVQAWQSADVVACVARADMSLYVTQDKTHDDADVVYALFCARVVTLALRARALQPPLSPLLHAGRTDNDDSDNDNNETVADVDVAAVRRFFVPPTQSSHARVVVFEGGDGCGKATQTRLLVEHLSRGDTDDDDDEGGGSNRAGHNDGDEGNDSDQCCCRRRGCSSSSSVHTLDFPHDASLYGVLLRVLLSGHKGPLRALDARLFSLLYSLNRYDCAVALRDWCWRGAVVVLDRYYTSNFGHQACKLPLAQRARFIADCERFETTLLRLPRADVVFYLDLPPHEALRAMRRDDTRAYLDIHETAGDAYKQRVRQTYLWCCAHLPGWRCVPCLDDAGQRRTRADVHAHVCAQLSHAVS